MSSLDYLDLCRLCLVKDRVSVPIFEGEGDVRQIFLKITACLPVKVNREDKLPKKICDDCVYKVELCYQFWHTTANAEKQLLQWLGEVNMEDKQGYNVLNPNGVKADQNNENRLDGTVMQQVSEHQNNMNMNMMDNMSLSMPMMMSSNTQQQITSVPMDNSGSSVQNVQPVAGPSTQTTHDQITQNQTDAPTQQEEEEESSDEDENSDDECDGDEGLPIKEESEEDPMSNRTIEPTTFVNVSLACDEPGPSGLQQQKITDMPEIVIPQTSDVDPKTGKMKKKGNWNEENMKEALKQITEKKMTQKQAAETFHVPKTTLGDRYRALQIGETVTFTPQMGRFKMTFDKELEAQLVSYIKDLDKKFMPFSRSEFLKFSYDLAEHLKLKHRFNKEIKTAGKRFYYDFMARNPSLSLRSPESTSLQKALGFDRHQVDRFFNRYSELLMKYNFSANKIHNCDETGVPIVHDNIIKVISQKGKKQVSKITSAERGRNVTVLLSINAAGNIFVPPLFVYPKQRVDAILKKDAPPGSIFIAEESGWITAKAFLKWLELFVERTQPTEKEPVLLIVDGHASHKDLDVILFAKQHHVHMLSLLPHTTHKLQPLDRAVMQPFKAAYNQACSIWMRKFQPLKITLRDIAGLINTAYISICRMDLAQSAFECTGLWPFNPAIFTDLDFIPSEHFQQPESVATPVIYLPEFQEPSTSFVSEPTNINILFQSSPADEPSHFMEICPTDECSNLMEIVKIISPTANIEEMRKKKKQRKN